MNELPEEILIQIFNELEQKDVLAVLRVNQLFKSLVWRYRVELHITPAMPPGYVAGVLEQALRLKRVYFRGMGVPFPDLWDGCKTKIDILSFRKCSRIDLNLLRSPAFANLSCLYLTESDPVTKYIPLFPKTLTGLSLECCTKIKDEDVLSISKICPSLKSLNLTGCYKLSDVRCVIENCYLLEELNVFKIRHAVNPSFFEAIVKHSKNLSSLNLVDCNLTDTNIKQLADCLGPKLKTLIIKFNMSITTDSIKYLCMTCYNLENLDIQALSVDDSIFEELSVCSNLKLVDFRDCASLSIGMIPWLKRSRCLEEIRLRNLNINDDIVLALRDCPSLRLIDLQSCKNITSHGIIPLVTSIMPFLRLVNLTEIDFSEEEKKHITILAKNITVGFT